MKYSAKISNDEGETIAKISALSFESLEEQLHKLKAFDIVEKSDEPEVDHYEETLQNIELNNQSLTS